MATFLIHENLRRAIYLKGLLLAETTPGRSASITKLPLMFGYNFAQGSTNRERQSVAGADEEGKAILGVWHRVLEVKPSMVEDLSLMLNDGDTDYADIHRASKRMGYDTADRLRKQLRLFADGWYYCAEDKSKVSGKTKQSRRRPRLANRFLFGSLLRIRDSTTSFGASGANHLS